MFKELENKLPLLIYDYGNIDTFTSTVSSLHGTAFNRLLLELLDQEVTVLSPNDFKSSLYELNDSGFLTEDSIILTEPYQVYDLHGKFLYQVLDHGGLFGYDDQDTSLLLNAKELDFYYLKYETYQGTQLYLVVINKYINSFRIQQLLDQEHHNNLESQVIVNQSPMIRFTYEGSEAVSVYFLEATPTSQIRFSDLAIADNLLESFESTLDYYPEKAGYFAFKVNGSQLMASGVTGTGSDRWIDVGDGVHYAAYSASLSPVLLKRTFGLSEVPSSDIKDFQITVSFN